MERQKARRPAAIRAQQTFVTNGAAYQASSDDEDNEARPTTRTSRRGTRVDLTKLDGSSLLRYRKWYKLGEATPTATREELLPSVMRHFATQIADEEEVLLKFVQAVQRHNKLQLQQQQQQKLMPQGGGFPKKPLATALPARPGGPSAGINKLRK